MRTTGQGLALLSVLAVAVASGCGPAAPAAPVAPAAPAATQAASTAPAASAGIGHSPTPGGRPQPTSVPGNDVTPWLAAGTDAGWTIDEMRTGSVVTAILSGDPAVLAGSIDMAPAVWVTGSAGTTAERLPLADPSLALAAIGTVAGGGDRIVIAGRASTSRCAHPDGAAIWVGTAGTWAAKPFEEIDCTRIPVALAAGPAGFMAVTMASGEIYGVWRSDDGLAWTTTTPADAQDAQLFGGTYAAGRYLVFGRAGAGAAIWSSPDASTWTRVALPGADPPAIVGTEAVAIAASTNGGDLHVRRTTDGEHWAEVPAPAGAIAFFDAAGRLFAAGGRRDADGNVVGQPRLWTSDDGLAWAQIALPVAAPLAPDLVARVGDRLLLVGDAPDGASRVALLTAWPAP